MLRYSHDGGRTYRRLGERTSATSVEEDFSGLPGGDACRLRVVVTDGYHNHQSTSPEFSVGVLPVEAFIVSPLDGATLQRGQPALLVGQSYYVETDERLEDDLLSWSSSLQGRLGEGSLVQAQLQPGEHEIRLHAEAGPRSGADSIKLTVQ